MRESKSLHIKAGQGNPVGGKESQKQAKESETHLELTARRLKNRKLAAITYMQESWCSRPM